NHVSQKELATHLQEANLCVSFSNYETFGIVMPEAISCGTFVISTNTGILNELKPQNFFSIIPVKDLKALVTEISKQYKNPTQLNTEKMHSYIETKFSQEVISDAFSNLYYKIINENS
ncbi:MAG: glycosyltransferase involved in cell wall biosynthesis, partial [Polaribacter sp.]